MYVIKNIHTYNTHTHTHTHTYIYNIDPKEGSNIKIHIVYIKFAFILTVIYAKTLSKWANLKLD
jgi:hypothetical protein